MLIGRARLPEWCPMGYLLGEKLRHLRLQHQLTQLDLAQRLNLESHSHIAKLETGKTTPSLAFIVRVARLFGISTDYLLRDAISIDASITTPRISQSDDKELIQEFGARMRTLRLQRGINQTQYAQQLGISRSYLANMEAGRKAPSPTLVVTIADLFGVTTDELIAPD